MKNFLQVNLNLNQLNAMARNIWKHVAMIFAVLVMSMANIGMAWGAVTYHSIVPNIDKTNYETYYLYSNGAAASSTNVVGTAFSSSKLTYTTACSSWVEGNPTGKDNSGSPGDFSAQGFYKTDAGDLKYNGTSMTFHVTNCVGVALLGKGNSNTKPLQISVKEKDSSSEVGSVASTTGNSVMVLTYGTTLNASKKYDITITSVSGGNSYAYQIRFEAPDGGVTKPTFSPATGSSLVKSSGTVTLTSAGNTVYYKWSQTDNQYASGAGATLAGAADGSGTSPVNATAPSTAGTWYLYAVAKNGGDYSDVVKATYTITNPTHTLTWNLDGGTATGGTAAGAVAEGATLTAPTVTKVGYDFAGWSPAVPATMPAADATYTATWTKVYASGTYNFYNNATLGTAPNQKTITTSYADYDAFRIDNIFFSAVNMAYESGSTATGYDYAGWKIKKNNATIKFFVENDSEVTISIGRDNTLNVSYTNTAGASQTPTITSGNSSTYSVKGGTMVTLTMSTSSTITIKQIAIAAIAGCTAPNHVDISGNYHFFPGETLALTATAYSTAGTSDPIAAGDITGYQWQKYIGSDWEDIVGETSATYTKANATTSDVGQYRCTISTGATCSTTSDQFNVKCLQLYVYWDNKSDKCNLAFTKTSSTTATANVLLENSSYTYYFKVTDGCGNWWGNDGTMTSSNCSGWSLNVNNHCGLTTSKAATYTFNLTYNAGLTSHSMSVVYPASDQAASYNLYFANDERNWAADKIYYRIGRDDHNSKFQMTKVYGTANLFHVTTSAYSNFDAWHIANNGGWSDYNSVYKTKNLGDWTITEATRFEGAPIPSGGWTIIPGSDHSTGATTGEGGSTDNANNNCEFYSFTTVPGMWTHNVSITPPSHGTLTVNYITTTNEPAAFSSGNCDLAHTANYCVTAEEGDGYTVASITINGTPVANRSWHVLTEDVVVAATFTLADYTITHSAASNGTYTIKVGDAAAVSTNTTANYNQTITLAATPSDGYELSSWTVTKASGGTIDVVNNQFTMPNDNVTITATFTLKTYTITYNAGTGDGITGSHANDTKTHGVNLTLPGVTFTRTGYTQTGWATLDGGSQAYALSASYTANAAANLYPVWTAKTTAITLDKNNSDPGSTSGSVTATYGSKDVTSLVHATRTGYTQNGYETTTGTLILKSDGTFDGTHDGYTSSKTWVNESAELTLYARWTANKFNVTHTLSNVTRSSGGEAGSNKATYGTAYSVVFAATSGYALPATVTVTVGGGDVTANCTWNQGTGTLTIPAAYVTGDIVITVTGVIAASVSATLLTDTYVRTGSSDVQLSVSVTGASSGWYYRIHNTKTNGYHTPDNTTYSTTTWTMTSGVDLGENPLVVELYNGSNVKMAESSTITV